MLVLALINALDHVSPLGDGWRLLRILKRAHGLPRVDVVQDHVRRNRQRVVKESFFDDLGLLRVFIVDFRKLLVVQWNLVPFDEVVIEVDWQDLWVLEGFLRLREVLMINVLLNIWVSGRGLLGPLLLTGVVLGLRGLWLLLLLHLLGFFELFLLGLNLHLVLVLLKSLLLL